MASKFASDKTAIAQCDRCGFRFKLKLLKNLIIKNKNVSIKVCAECWEPSHPQLQLGSVPVNDPQAIREPRPDHMTTDGSRVIQWGWNPVGLSSASIVWENSLTATCSLGTVTVTIT